MTETHQTEDNMSEQEFSFDEVVATIRRGDVVRWLARLDTAKAILLDMDQPFLAGQLTSITAELYTLLELQGLEE